MEKRALFATILSLAVLFGWQVLFPPPKPSPAKPGNGVAAETTARQRVPERIGGPAGEPEPTPSRPTAVALPAGAEAPPAADEVGTHRQPVTLANEVLRVVFDNKGGLIASIELLGYDDTAGKPLKLVKQDDLANARAPLALEIEGGPEDLDINKELFVVTPLPGEHEKDEDNAATARGAGARLTWRRGGLAVVKELRLGSGYMIDVEVSVQGAHSWQLSLGPGLRDVSPGEEKSRFTQEGSALWSADGKVDRLAAEKVDEEQSVDEDDEARVTFAGFEDNYFMGVLIPREPALAVLLRPTPMAMGSGEGAAKPKKKEKEGSISMAFLSAGDSQGGRLFFGPKDYGLLTQYHLGLERAIDFGIFGFLAYPLLVALKFLHGYTSNYGVAIIVLTVVIKLILFPLTYKQMVSMKKMQALQPKMNAIKERYKKFKNDAQQRAKMNQEFMKLYQQEGVNPMGGCLPLLVQLPILIAFYNMLSYAIELRHAPFFGWIADLSVKDPYYVTPLLMGVTMFVQQQITPASVDPVQKRIFMMMPFIFTFMFLGFPSGLVLYWLVNNVLSIVQQLILNKRLPSSPAQDGSKPE